MRQLEIVVGADHGGFRSIGIGHESEADDGGRFVIAEEELPVCGEVAALDNPFAGLLVPGLEDDEAGTPGPWVDESLADGSIVGPHVVDSAGWPQEGFESDKKAGGMIELFDLLIGATGRGLINFPAPLEEEVLGGKTRKFDGETRGGAVSGSLDVFVSLLLMEGVFGVPGEFDRFPLRPEAILEVFAKERIARKGGEGRAGQKERESQGRDRHEGSIARTNGWGERSGRGEVLRPSEREIAFPGAKRESPFQKVTTPQFRGRRAGCRRGALCL